MMETVKYLMDYGGHQAGEVVLIELYGAEGADGLAERGIVEILVAEAAPAAEELVAVLAVEEPAAKKAAGKKTAAGKKSGGKAK
jgi:hypothetical protein